MVLWYFGTPWFGAKNDQDFWDFVTFKYLPLPRVVEEFQMEITKSCDKGLRKSFAGNLKMRHVSAREGGKLIFFLDTRRDFLD